MFNLCRCLVLKITQNDELGIQLSEPYESIPLQTGAEGRRCTWKYSYLLVAMPKKK